MYGSSSCGTQNQNGFSSAAFEKGEKQTVFQERLVSPLGFVTLSHVTRPSTDVTLPWVLPPPSNMSPPTGGARWRRQPKYLGLWPNLQFLLFLVFDVFWQNRITCFTIPSNNGLWHSTKARLRKTWDSVFHFLCSLWSAAILNVTSFQISFCYKKKKKKKNTLPRRHLQVFYATHWKAATNWWRWTNVAFPHVCHFHRSECGKQEWGQPRGGHCHWDIFCKSASWQKVSKPQMRQTGAKSTQVAAPDWQTPVVMYWTHVCIRCACVWATTNLWQI